MDESNLKWNRIGYEFDLPPIGKEVWATDEWPYIYVCKRVVNSDGTVDWVVNGSDGFYPDCWAYIPEEPI